MYVDAVGKLGRQAQQGTWGGCADIGKHFKHFVNNFQAYKKALYLYKNIKMRTHLRTAWFHSIGEKYAMPQY